MNVKQLLDRMPEKARLLFADIPSYVEPLKRGKTLHELLSSEAELVSAAGAMHPWELEALKRIVSSFGSRPFDWQSLERAAQADPLSGVELRLAIALLRRKGILFALRKSWGERFYVMPSDTLSIWQKLFLPIGGLTDGEEETVFSPAYGIVWDLMAIVRYFSENETAVTKAGIVPKRQCAALADRMVLRWEHLDLFELAYDHRESYPPQLALLLEIAFRLRLLSIEDKKIAVTTIGAADLFAQPNDKILAGIYRIWQDCCPLAKTWLLHVHILIENVRLERASIRITAIKDWLMTYRLVPTEEAASAMQTLGSWLEAMDAFGWVMLDTGKDGEIVVRPRNSPEPPIAAEISGLQPSFIIQPDFELFLPEETPFSVMWELESIAERVRFDRVLVYRLTKESIRRAVDAGWTVERCRRFLTEGSYTGVPDNVDRTLGTWFQQAERTDEEDGNCSLLKKQLQTVLSTSEENFILINRDRESDGLLFRSKELGEVDGMLPEPAELMPDVRQVPAKWLKELRSYHSSTCKELLRQALEWKTQVRLGIQGAERTIVPSRIIEEQGSWKLVGRAADEIVELSAESVQTVQILVPSLNPSSS